MIHVILGPDNRSARSAVHRLSEAADPSGLNTSVLDGRSVTAEEAIAAISAPGFFGGSRVVIIEDLIARLSKSGRGTSDDAETPAGFDLRKLFAAVPPEHCLILADRSLTSLPVAVKRALPEGARVETCEAPRGPSLVAWIRQRASDGISDAAAAALLSRLYPKTWELKPANPLLDRAPDLDALANAVELLAAAAHPGKIEGRHVQEMIPEAAEDRLFPFADALFAGNTSAAARELQTLRDRGEEPGRITAQIVQTAELLAVSGAAHTRRDPAEIGKELGLPNPQRMHVIARTAERSAGGSAWLTAALEADRAVKRGVLRQPWDPLYALLGRSTYKARN
jgi:DNA polymerase III delta subunit